ncbi:MAG: dTMP kinase [Sphingomonadaceae bacterium]
MTGGRFIVLEGGEGVGKSTQAKLLADSLRQQGFSVRQTREPGGTEGAEAIRKLLLHPPGSGWGSRAEALLFAAARADHVEKVIRPALMGGEWVICDRFLDSSRAYQGGAGGVDDSQILQLHAIGSEDLRPDLTILIELDPALSARRIALRDGEKTDAIGGREDEYHVAVASSFHHFAEQAPDHYVLIDGARPPAEIHGLIMGALTPLMDIV